MPYAAERESYTFHLGARRDNGQNYSCFTSMSPLIVGTVGEVSQAKIGLVSLSIEVSVTKKEKVKYSVRNFWIFGLFFLCDQHPGSSIPASAQNSHSEKKTYSKVLSLLFM